MHSLLPSGGMELACALGAAVGSNVAAESAALNNNLKKRLEYMNEMI